MSSLLPSLPTAPVIRPSAELQSDPCCDKAEQVKHEIKTFADLNHTRPSFKQLRGFWTRVRAESLGGSGQASRDHRRCSRVCRCLLSSSGAVFLALAQVNHSTLTIFALPLYKRRGTGPTDPITSLSENKCLTIQPYWVWEINPFHSRARPISSENREADVTVIIIVRHQISQTSRPGEFIVCFQGRFFPRYSLPLTCCCLFILLFHISYFLRWCVAVPQIIYVFPLHPKM